MGLDHSIAVTVVQPSIYVVVQFVAHLLLSSAATDCNCGMHGLPGSSAYVHGLCRLRYGSFIETMALPAALHRMPSPHAMDTDTLGISAHECLAIAELHCTWSGYTPQLWSLPQTAVNDAGLQVIWIQTQHTDGP